MAPPMISIIIPTFNRCNSLRNAVQSVLDQTFINFELIVVDDGSEDNTATIVHEFGDPRLVYQPIEHSGVSIARNIGVASSKGQYIAFLDSDDIWHPDKLTRQIEYLNQHTELQICQTQEIWIRKGRRVNPKIKHVKPSGYIFPESLLLCTITPSSVLMTRELFSRYDGFDPKMPACEDYDLWLRITANHEVGLIDELLLTKTGGHQDQLSQTFPAMDRFRIYSLGKILLQNQLNQTQKNQALKVYLQKCEILLNGIKKRHSEKSELIQFLEGISNLESSSDDFLIQAETFLLSDTYFK